MAKKNKKEDINENEIIDNIKKDIFIDIFGLKENKSSLSYFDSLLNYRGDLFSYENYNFYKYIEEKCIKDYRLSESSCFILEEKLDKNGNVIDRVINIKTLPNYKKGSDIVFNREGLSTRNKNPEFANWIDSFVFAPVVMTEPISENNQTIYKHIIRRMKLKHKGIDYTNIDLFYDLILYPTLLYFVDFENKFIDFQGFMYHVYKHVLLRTKGIKQQDRDLLDKYLYNNNEKNDVNKLTENQSIQGGDDLSNPSDLLKNGVNATTDISKVLNNIYK